MKSSERKKALVEAGMKLFMEKGYEQVSVEDICRAINVSKPTFYNRVGRKEMILVEYFQSHEEDSIPKAKALLEQNRPAAAFQMLFTAAHDVAMELGPELYSVYIRYLLHNPDTAERIGSTQVDAIAACLEQLQKQDYISSRQNPKDLATMLLQINDGLTVVWASQNGGFNMVELFQDWCRILLGVHRYPKGVKPPEHINPHTAILS